MQNHAYETLAAVESDLKRMVNNAKTYNEKKSAIYEDAERLRKTASNFMTKHNPAYRDPSYVAVPTPIPEEVANASNGVDEDEGVEEEEEKVAEDDDEDEDEPDNKATTAPKHSSPATKGTPRRNNAPFKSETPGLVPESGNRQTKGAKPALESAAADDNEESQIDFTGKTFQEAQDMIIDNLIKYTDER